MSATTEFKCWKCQNRARESTHSLHIFAWICASKLLLWLLLLLLFRCEYAPCHTYAWPSTICVFLCAQDLSNCPTFISISYWYGHVCNYLCWLRCVCSAFRSQSHCFFSFVFAHLYFIRSISVCYSLTTRFEPDSGIGSFFEPFSICICICSSLCLCFTMWMDFYSRTM